MKWHYRDRVFQAYRCELIGTLLWAVVIEVLIAIALKVISPELEGGTPKFSEGTTAILGMILTGITILLSLLAAPVMTTQSR